MVKHISHNDLMQMEQRQRAAFVNALGGFKSVNMVGTVDMSGLTNLAIFNSIVHLGANPPLMGCIVRPDSVERHTYENILETGYYSFNHVNANCYEKAHQTSARYPKHMSEFEACGLTPYYQDGSLAPYVKESGLQIGLRFREKIDITLNGTILLIGEIMHVYVPEACIQADGFVDLEMAGTLAGSGLDSYHATHKLARLKYAKPNLPPETIPES